MSLTLFVALEYGILFTLIFSIVHSSSSDSEEILQNHSTSTWVHLLKISSK